MMSRRMYHVVYRSIGVTGAALGAAKKIDLKRTESGTREIVTIVTLAAGPRRAIGSWSRGHLVRPADRNPMA